MLAFDNDKTEFGCDPVLIPLHELRRTEKNVSDQAEIMRAQMRELAEGIFTAGDFSDSEHLQAQLAALHTDLSVAPDVLPENRHTVGCALGSFGGLGAVLFCEELTRLISAGRRLTAEDFWGRSDPVNHAAAHKIAYHANAYADTAFLRFSDILATPRAVSTDSFNGACEEVYNGLCEYCLLPVEIQSGGRLRSFFDLIDRYELKTETSCFIPTNDGIDSTRFVLLRKNIKNLTNDTKNRHYFEFTISIRDGGDLIRILQAGDYCGLKLCALDSQSQGSAMAATVIRPSFRIDGADFLTFLMFMKLAYPQYTLTGLYRDLSAGTGA